MRKGRPIMFSRGTNPVAAVQTLVAIVSQNEIMTRWYDDLSVANDAVHLYPPARIHLRTDVVSGREIIAVRVELLAFMDCKTGIVEGFAVHEDSSVEQMNVISGDSHHAFHKMLRRMHRISKDNNVSAM